MTYSKIITVNPLKMESALLDFQCLEVLAEFFRNVPTGTLLNKEYCYEYKYQNIKYRLWFTHSLLKPDEMEEQFAIFDTTQAPLGKGFYGAVYPVLGTIQFKASQSFLNRYAKEVIKIEDHMHHERKALVEAEYQFLKRAGYLQVKPPVFVFEDNSKKSYLLMDKAEGCTLETLLWDKGRHGRLTVKERLDITLAILHAVKSQVTDKGIVHRDLKPLNMLIDMKKNPPIVAIIDYGRAMFRGKQDARIVGTPAYRSPESFITPVRYSEKSDAYAVGRILSYVWGDSYKNYYLNNRKSWSWPETKQMTKNHHLFTCTGAHLFKSDEAIIRTCLNGLLHEDPATRFSLEEAIELFSTVARPMYQLETIQTFSKAKLHNYEHRLKLINKLLHTLAEKEVDLGERGFIEIANKVKKLHKKLAEYTNKFMENPDPILLPQYSKRCFDTINKYRPFFQKNRDLQWLISEIAAVIGLLVVGYGVAVGVNYLFTKRWGLFSQPRTDRITENIKNNIHGLLDLTN
ncbi:Dot/Icm T4SS effector kinase LegK1 [Legionella rowbothamii]|uniref:Dot/Icm T4SS effector kinase LegK1 n=1 Tax=Legionella rowbothamii TaxID=96229 RepID=UPI0013EFA9C7|nr:Dot/Icm T4SS effector kinase LegK1 [Legionella rowbothamii]